MYCSQLVLLSLCSDGIGTFEVGFFFNDAFILFIIARALAFSSMIACASLSSLSASVSGNLLTALYLSDALLVPLGSGESGGGVCVCVDIDACITAILIRGLEGEGGRERGSDPLVGLDGDFLSPAFDVLNLALSLTPETELGPDPGMDPTSDPGPEPGPDLGVEPGPDPGPDRVLIPDPGPDPGPVPISD